MDSTLLKGLRVLEHLARSDTARGVSDLARELGITKSNIHRTLQTLVAAGYVQLTPGGLYECTLKVFELGSFVLRRIDLRSVAEPFMRALADKTRETIHLSVLECAEVVYLHKIESPQPVRAYSSIGGRAPAQCVASGKALLAYQQEDPLRYFSDPLPAYTPCSIRTVARLRKELTKIRQQGFAVNSGEWRESVCGLAAIVHGDAGLPVASIGISGPSDRLKPEVIENYKSVVMEIAKQLSTALGYNPDMFAPTTAGKPLTSPRAGTRGRPAGHSQPKNPPAPAAMRNNTKR